MRDFTPRPKLKDTEGYVPKEKKRKPIKKVSDKKLAEQEDGGMLHFFITLWELKKPFSQYVPREYVSVEEWRENTEQYRVCAITFTEIKTFAPGCFAHVMTKNHTKWKYERKNIVLMQYECHQAQEFGGDKRFSDMGEGAFWFKEYKEKLKQEYNQLK